MNLNAMASNYINALLGKVQVEGGLLFHHAIDLTKLNFSTDSLKYIDELLDLLNEAGIDEAAILDNQAGQNLLYALAFYVGAVVGKENQCEVVWISYGEFSREYPDKSKIIEENFGTSIMYKTKGSLQIPLSGIMTRLFEGPNEKSVWYSAMGAIEALPPSEKRKWKLG